MSALIVAFRPLLYLFYDVERRVGKHKLFTYGAGVNGRISVGWHSVIAKDHPLVRRNRKAQLSSHQQLYRWYCHGHFNIVKSRPRWRHNWRYAPSPCRALPWIPWTHVLAIQMVNVYPQSSTNTIWRSAVWFFKPDSVNIQANFFGIGIVYLKIYFSVLNVKNA